MALRRDTGITPAEFDPVAHSVARWEALPPDATYLTPRQFAAQTNLSLTAVYSRTRQGLVEAYVVRGRWGLLIPTRALSLPVKPLPRLCAYCGTQFAPDLESGKYCHPRCRLNAYKARQQAKAKDRAKTHCAGCDGELIPGCVVGYRFCSKRCYNRTYERENRNAINAKRRERYEKNRYAISERRRKKREEATGK